MTAAASGPVIEVAVVQSGETPADADVALDELIARFEEAAEGADLVVFPELATTPYFCGVVNDSRKSWAQPVPGPPRHGSRRPPGDSAPRSRSGCTRTPVTRSTTAPSSSTPTGPWCRAPTCTATGPDLPQDLDPEGRPLRRRREALLLARLRARRVRRARHPLRHAHLLRPELPEYWLAARAAGAEVMLVFVSSMGFRETLFTQELQVRAMETQTWVVAPNRGGQETLDGKTVSYFGRSSVVTPRGALVVSAPAHEAGPVVRATVDVAEVAAARGTSRSAATGSRASSAGWPRPRARGAGGAGVSAVTEATDVFTIVRARSPRSSSGHWRRVGQTPSPRHRTPSPRSPGTARRCSPGSSARRRADQRTAGRRSARAPSTPHAPLPTRRAPRPPSSSLPSPRAPPPPRRSSTSSPRSGRPTPCGPTRSSGSSTVPVRPQPSPPVDGRTAPRGRSRASRSR